MITAICGVYNSGICHAKQKNQQMAIENSAVIQNTCQLPNYELSKAGLVFNNISFGKYVADTEAVLPKSFAYNIDCDANIKEPQVSIDITNDMNFPMKQGIKSIYLFALNDQLNEIPLSVDITDVSLNMNNFKRNLKFSCPADSIVSALDSTGGNFINTKISSKHINNAKQIAPVGYFLYGKTGDFKKEYSDLSPKMTEQEYEQLVNNITENDIKNLNNKIIKNSDVKITIKMNKTDYDNYKDKIENYINKDMKK